MNTMTLLEEFHEQLRRLANNGVNVYDKEVLMYMLTQVNNIIEYVDDEARRIQAVVGMMESRTFSQCQDSVQQLIAVKRRELEAWDEIRMMIYKMM